MVVGGFFFVCVCVSLWTNLGCFEAAQNRGLERADINREFGPSSGPSSRSEICAHILLAL
jgi:hypothetical protein